MGQINSADRFLGIDYGTKRIGLATSDAQGIAVQPVTVLNRTKLVNDIEQIAAVCVEREVSRIVVGMPYNMNGSPGRLAGEVQRFADEVGKKTQLPVVFYDERLTSHAAEEYLIQDRKMSPEKRKKMKDKIAACIILSSYLASLRQS